MAKTIQYLDLDGLKALYGVVDGKITTAVNNAKGELKGTATTDYDTLGKLEGKIKDEASRAVAAETALVGRLDALESGDSSVGTQIDALKTQLIGDATTLTNFGAVEDKIDVINGTGEGSIKKAVGDAVASIVANAPEDFDTLKEVADWIANDTTGAASMQNDIATLKGEATVKGSVAHSIKTAVEDLDATVGEAAVAANKHVAVQVVETDGKITAVNVNEKDIASAATLNSVKTEQEKNTELLTGIPADKKVKGYVDEAVDAAKAAATTKVVKGGEGTHVTVTAGVPAADGSVTYTIGETDIASASTLADVKTNQEANTTAIANAIDEELKKITLGTKSLQFVAFTAQEIQAAAEPTTGN